MHNQEQAAKAGAPPSPFDVMLPKHQTLPFVYNAPHSGIFYPPDLLAASRLSLAALRSSEDSFADRLFGFVTDMGAPMLRVNFARAYVDTNRGPTELDAHMFEGALPGAANARSDRVRAGLGLIPGVVAGGQKIYDAPLPVPEALIRIERVYRPAHRALNSLIEETARRFGYAVLIDCHSMPSGVTLGRDAPRQVSDIVLGDAHGTSCSSVLTETAASALREMGYTVAVNAPYAGGYNTHFYGTPSAGRHALQIEINRGLYMDELSFEPNERFSGIRADMERLVGVLHAIPAIAFRPAANEPPLAAE